MSYDGWLITGNGKKGNKSWGNAILEMEVIFNNEMNAVDTNNV